MGTALEANRPSIVTGAGRDFIKLRRLSLGTRPGTATAVLEFSFLGGELRTFFIFILINTSKRTVSASITRPTGTVPGRARTTRKKKKKK